MQCTLRSRDRPISILQPGIVCWEEEEGDENEKDRQSQVSVTLCYVLSTAEIIMSGKNYKYPLGCSKLS